MGSKAEGYIEIATTATLYSFHLIEMLLAPLVQTAITKIAQTGWLKHNLFLIIQRLGSPRSNCQQIQGLKIASSHCIVALPYLRKIHSKTPGGCQRPRIALNSVYTLCFFLYIHPLLATNGLVSLISGNLLLKFSYRLKAFWCNMQPGTCFLFLSSTHKFNAFSIFAKPSSCTVAVTFAV